MKRLSPPAPHEHPASPPPPVADLRYTRGRVHIKSHQRGIDATTAWRIFLYSPHFLGSLAVVYVATRLIPPVFGWVVLGAWLLSGVLAFVRPFERPLARYLFGLREPSPGEHARLTPLWREVTVRAGVDADAYDLWIEESDGINACAAAGHIVAVTPLAMEELTDGELAAVLAHELGHHTGGHPWSSLLGAWYAAPARMVWRLLRRVVERRSGLTSRGSTALVLACVAVLVCLLFSSAAWLVVVALPALPFVQAAVGRRSELRADDRAADLGFAPQLSEALAKVEGEDNATTPGAAASRAPSGFIARLLVSHPDVNQRRNRLDKRLPRAAG
ncbi:M48 family metalloprotease [Streptomyces sp. PT12]|uniref:M48 family metalloprotease n=1 Tax=Streptomyces sp. PT12 TaxID=1510197 RepID=UPI000DE3CF60|nr:M48 family metalloprotease [Streptomyces sp. PT12]RBM06911.1 peptidase [Streptomyces sp. PT12]